MLLFVFPIRKNDTGGGTMTKIEKTRMEKLVLRQKALKAEMMSI